MASTVITYVPAGAQSTPMMITPLQNVFVAPQVLGGTTQFYTGPTPVGPWTLTSSATDSFRPQNSNVYYYVAAATQQATVVQCDMTGSNTASVNQLCSMNGILASSSGTAIQKIFSIRIPPNYLPLNSRMTFFGAVNLTNNANVKTLTCLINGIGGTSFFTSPSLASNALYTFTAQLAFDGTGQLIRGFGSGATGGLGLSTTAPTTLAFNYVTTELEIVIAATKATAGDTFELHSLLVQLD